MRERKKLFVVVALLSAILIVSVVFSSGVIDISTFSLGGSSSAGAGESLEPPEVFVDPDKIVKDYLADPSYQIGNTFSVNINITNATGLFAWQINMSWGPCMHAHACGYAMVNVSNIIAGEFLNRVTPPNYTTSAPAPNGLGFVINKTDNATGYTAMGESILGGAPAISGNGTLVTVEFLIVGYGSTDLFINLTGTLPTTLLDSTGGIITPSQIDGYFRNKLKGDVDMNGAVDFLNDFTLFQASYLKQTGQPGYNREADTDYNGAVDFLTDFTDFQTNYLTSVSL